MRMLRKRNFAPQTVVAYHALVLIDQVGVPFSSVS